MFSIKTDYKKQFNDCQTGTSTGAPPFFKLAGVVKPRYG